MIKTLATDLDGTLFFPKRKLRLLSSKNTKFLKEFVHEKNGHLILVSGRNFSIGKRVAKKINYDKISMIGCNGSVIYHDGKVVYEDPIPKEDVRFLYQNIKEENEATVVMFMTNKQVLIIIPLNMSKTMMPIGKIGMMLQGAYREDYLFGEKELEAALDDPDTSFYKVMPCYGLTHRGSETARIKTLNWREKLNNKYEILWSSNSVEIMKKQVNKANALKRLLNMLELEESFTAVVGDSGNDVPLFEAFDQSFCMKNAPLEVQEKAKIIVEGVHEIKNYL